jgi:hypothetical protein
MFNLPTIALVAVLPLSVLSSPMMSVKSPLAKRFDLSECVDSSVDAPAGKLFCVNSDGTDLYCSDCYDADSSWASCYQATEDDSSLGNKVACPKDPAPANGPDGNPVEAADGFIRSFCDTAVSLPGLAGQFGTITGCLLWGAVTAENEAEANEAGLFALCDTFLAGACSAFRLLNSDAFKVPDNVQFCIDNPDATLDDGTTCEDFNNLMSIAA